MINENKTEGSKPPRDAREAARKAAQTRRKKQAAWDAEIRRRIFVVTNERDWRQSYGPVWMLFRKKPSPNFFDVTNDYTLNDVIADVVERFSLPRYDDPTVSDDIEPDVNDVEPDVTDVGSGFNGEDVAVWRDGRLLAVLRAGADGKPAVTRFEA